jgi:hypothetical protein
MVFVSLKSMRVSTRCRTAMVIVEVSDQTENVHDSRAENHDMHDLMASTENVECTREKLFWELDWGKYRGKVRATPDPRTLKAYAVAPAVLKDMRPIT